MSIAAAVKEAIVTGCGDYWALNLPEKMKDAYYSGYAELRRERGDEIHDAMIMAAAVQYRIETGVRGLCF